ncbi:MAG: cofactor-independent phosphoglycerate mutase [Firmicutes bacterium]|nr:cofactor-independent phosphoglycerate mutase [Bacillota bacterium]
MKYLIIVPDGAADEPIEALGGKTPLEAANIPNIDKLGSRGVVGNVSTVPEGMSPGSDVANLSVMGYDPARYHTGRSPLEAASIGIDLADTDVAMRCNLITLSGEGAYEDLIIQDHSSGDITTEEADLLVQALNEKFATDKIHLYTGTSYRHALIIKEGETHYDLTPPHDVLGQRAGDNLPKGEGAEFLEKMMRESYEILSQHPVNKDRIARGLNPANSMWVWGLGKKPSLSSFSEKYGLSGAAISAVDLIKGIGICAGLDAIEVPGATGTLTSNFAGKAEAAIRAFSEGKDFIYLHMEAPDECSHQGELEGKIQSMELIDEKIVGPVISWLENSGEEYRVLVLPDHPTPLRIRTHSGAPVPFLLFDSTAPKEEDSTRTFCERVGAKGPSFASGWELADHFFKN